MLFLKVHLKETSGCFMLHMFMFQAKNNTVRAARVNHNGKDVYRQLNNEPKLAMKLQLKIQVIILRSFITVSDTSAIGTCYCYDEI